MYRRGFVYSCYNVDMKTISVAILRQNPTQALDEVERGETYIVTRHNREIGRLVPPERPGTVTADQFRKLLRATPLDHDWAQELLDTRGDFDDDNPWSERP